MITSLFLSLSFVFSIEPRGGSSFVTIRRSSFPKERLRVSPSGFSRGAATIRSIVSDGVLASDRRVFFRGQLLHDTLTCPAPRRRRRRRRKFRPSALSAIPSRGEAFRAFRGEARRPDFEVSGRWHKFGERERDDRAATGTFLTGTDGSETGLFQNRYLRAGVGSSRLEVPPSPCVHQQISTRGERIGASSPKRDSRGATGRRPSGREKEPTPSSAYGHVRPRESIDKERRAIPPGISAGSSSRNEDRREIRRGGHALFPFFRVPRHGDTDGPRRRRVKRAREERYAPREKCMQRRNCYSTPRAYLARRRPRGAGGEGAGERSSPDLDHK